MANVTVTFQYPAVRGSGRPFDPATVDRVDIELSADGGANYTVVGTCPRGTMSFVQTELEPGVWFFRGRVFDTNGRAGPYSTASVDTDDTAPGALGNFVVAITP